jgi:hypothetical protein
MLRLFTVCAFSNARDVEKREIHTPLLAAYLVPALPVQHLAFFAAVAADSHIRMSAQGVGASGQQHVAGSLSLIRQRYDTAQASCAGLEK